MVVLSETRRTGGHRRRALCGGPLRAPAPLGRQIRRRSTLAFFDAFPLKLRHGRPSLTAGHDDSFGGGSRLVRGLRMIQAATAVGARETQVTRIWPPRPGAE